MGVHGRLFQLSAWKSDPRQNKNGNRLTAVPTG